MNDNDHVTIGPRGIRVPTRKRIDLGCSGFTTKPDGTLSGNAMIEIDLLKLTRQIGDKLLHSKGKKVTLCYGAITITAHDVRHER